MDELQAALDRYVLALQEQGGETDTPAASTADPSAEPGLQEIDRSDLDAMIQSMRELAETGNRDGARQALSQLQQVLDSLHNPGHSPDAQTLTRNLEVLHQLQDLTTREHQLLDRGYRQSQGQEPDSNQDRQEQNRLRRELGAAMQQLGDLNGDIPKELGQAERAMHDAEQVLGFGVPGAAVPAQTQAVESLQQGIRALDQALARRMAGGRGEGRDPLGRRRPGQGGVGNGAVQLPEEREMQRARTILDELRRRAGQTERPRPELEYIDRLLRQF
jgi:hypothetical protein